MDEDRTFKTVVIGMVLLFIAALAVYFSEAGNWTAFLKRERDIHYCGLEGGKWDWITDKCVYRKTEIINNVKPIE